MVHCRRSSWLHFQLIEQLELAIVVGEYLPGEKLGVR